MKTNLTKKKHCYVHLIPFEDIMEDIRKARKKSEKKHTP